MYVCMCVWALILPVSRAERPWTFRFPWIDGLKRLYCQSCVTLKRSFLSITLNHFTSNPTTFCKCLKTFKHTVPVLATNVYSYRQLVNVLSLWSINKRSFFTVVPYKRYIFKRSCPSPLPLQNSSLWYISHSYTLDLPSLPFPYPYSPPLTPFTYPLLPLPLLLCHTSPSPLPLILSFLLIYLYLLNSSLPSFPLYSFSLTNPSSPYPYP